MIRRLFAIALLVVAAGCSHKTETQTTTTAPAGPAATVAPASGGRVMPVSAGHTNAVMHGAANGGNPPGFDTEAAAQTHCPADQVVWLNTKSHIYHEKGMRYYGSTKQGEYACRKEADAAGARDSKNGT